MHKEKPKLTHAPRGKEKPKKETYKEFSDSKAELAAKREALEAKFSAAEMGRGSEKELGKKYLELLKKDLEEALKDRIVRAAHNVQDPEKEIAQKDLARYYRALRNLHQILDSLEYDFDIELERGRTEEAARDVLAA